jgi:hypothetical protein
MKRSAWCMVATRGCGVVESEGAAPITLTGGEAVVVPADVEKFMLRPQWEIEFLCASLPTEKVGHPATALAEATTGAGKLALSK